MSDFDEYSRAVEEWSERGRRVVAIVADYFKALVAAGFSREEALALTRDYQEQLQELDRANRQ